MRLERSQCWLLVIAVMVTFDLSVVLYWQRTHQHSTRPQFVAKPGLRAPPAPRTKRKAVVKRSHKQKTILVRKARQPSGPVLVKLPAMRAEAPMPRALVPIAPRTNPVVTARSDPLTPPAFAFEQGGLSRALNPDWMLRVTAKPENRPPSRASSSDSVLPPITLGVQLDRKF